MEWLDNLKQRLIPREFRDPRELDDIIRNAGDAMDAADALTDPADRLKASLQVKEDMEEQRSTLWRRCEERATGMSAAVYLTSTIGGVLGGIGIALLAAPVAGAIVGGVGLVVGLGTLFTGRVESALVNTTSESLHPFAVRTVEVQTRAQKAVDEVLEKHTIDIAASEKFNGIYDRFPAIRDHFAKALSRASAQKLMPTSPSPQPQQPDSSPHP